MRIAKYIIIIIILFTFNLHGKTKLSLVLTSNMEGNFSYFAENQEINDKMLLLGESILREVKNGSLYFDLGNSFYPGMLSRYSSGIVIGDFFQSFKCSGTVISSNDLRIGIDSLEFVKKKNEEVFLSANLALNNKNIFKPYKILKIKNRTIAFIGISSKKCKFHIAEKQLYNVKVEDPKKILESLMPDIKSKSVNNIILLSGLDLSENIEILKIYRDIDLVICGGDNKGELLSGNISRMDIEDGRSLVALSRSSGYYNLQLEIDETVTITDFSFKTPFHIKTADENYIDYAERLTIWKKYFLNNYGKQISDEIRKESEYNIEKVSMLLRSKYKAEVAILKKGSVNPALINRQTSFLDIASSLNDNYSIFTYSVSGSHLLKMKENMPDHFFSGLYQSNNLNMIQGYPIEDNRNYRIVSTQTVFEESQKVIGSETSYKNKWKNISDIATEDIKSKQILLMDDYSYLDNIFRYIIDINLSYFSEQSRVKNDESLPTPSGQPEKSYFNIGTEDKIDLIIYNRWNKIIITPYIYFVKQTTGDEEFYIQNTARGTIFYSLNLDYLTKPYIKSRVDTLIVKQQGLRPTIVRETVGVDVSGKYITGNIGVGFEKQVSDPSHDLMYGLESIINLNVDFLSYFTYIFGLDAFFASGYANDTENKGYIRSQINNTLAFNFSRLLSLSLKHKWYYYFSISSDNSYSNSQFLISIDLKTGFKL